MSIAVETVSEDDDDDSYTVPINAVDFLVQQQQATPISIDVPCESGGVLFESGGASTTAVDPNFDRDNPTDVKFGGVSDNIDPNFDHDNPSRSTDVNRLVPEDPLAAETTVLSTRNQRTTGHWCQGIVH